MEKEQNQFDILEEELKACFNENEKEKIRERMKDCQDRLTTLVRRNLRCLNMVRQDNDNYLYFLDLKKLKNEYEILFSISIIPYVHTVQQRWPRVMHIKKYF